MTRTIAEAVPKASRPLWSKRAMNRPPLAALTLAATIVLVACPKPIDGDAQIAVSPNLDARCRLMPGRCSGKAKAPPEASARVHPMTVGGALGGPNATGKPGDWVLENDEVVFVVDGLGGGGGFAESGGNLIDAADARTRKDELGQLFTYFGTFPRQAVYTAMDAAQEPHGFAVLTARGVELYDPSIAVETEYRLGGSDRALVIRTTLTNTAAASVTLPALGDAVQWGGAEKVAPGKPKGFKGRSSGPFVGGVGRFVSYAITTPEGEISAISGGAWTDTEQQKNVVLAPGTSVSYSRIFAVGERADVASLVAELTQAAGGDVGAVEIALVDAAGAPVRAPAGARIALATAAAVGGDVMNLVAGEDGLTFGGEIPPGKWLVSYAPSVGRRALDGGAVAVTVTKGATARATLRVTDIAKLDARCTESDASGTQTDANLPCKITFEGREGTSAPDFGPAYASGPAKHQLIAHTGEVALAPGNYRLTFTRGPEYEAETADVALSAGETKALTRTLRRVVDTGGYVSTDFHQHTVGSADAPVSLRDRVLSNAAEGVEVAVATEHNNVVDLGPIVRACNMSPFVVAIAGDEITTDSSKKPWGHANVFPLAVEPSLPRGGAPSVRDRTAKDVLDEMRARPGPARVIQVNHPRSGPNGYFDQLGFDPKTGVGTGEGYDAGFDAIEVWNGRNVDARMRVLDDFLALLRTSHPVTAIADTDTHGVVDHEAGLPRTYVRTAKDDALESWDAARTEDLVRGVRVTRDVVLTNGPFLTVRANGAGIGAIARARAGVVEVKVHVISTAFASVDHAEIRVAGAGAVAPASVALVSKRNGRGALEADATFTVRARADDAFVVIVSGKAPMRPMFSGEDAEISPWAMTGAIWIDADGDGKSLAREANGSRSTPAPAK